MFKSLRRTVLVISVSLQETKMALIRHASYKCYGPGRWIMKEGHEAENMYLIVEGHVRITENKYNCLLEKMDIVEHCKLYAKHSFGQSAVMFDTRRTTSVQSLSKLTLREQQFIYLLLFSVNYAFFFFIKKTMLLNRRY